MSLPIIPSDGLTTGVYKIFNVQYPSQVADLVYPGGANGVVVGYNAANDPSKRVEWGLTVYLDVMQNQITLANQEIATYAQADINLPLEVVGNPDNPTIWSVNPTPTKGHYYILFDEVTAWTLADDNDGTPITLDLINIPTNDAQLWQFVPVG